MATTITVTSNDRPDPADRPAPGIRADSAPQGSGTGGAPGTGAGRPSLLDRAHRLSTFGTVLVVTVIALEAMAVATVLPATVRSLHGLPLYGWSFTAFFLANVVGIVDAGARVDRIGPRLPLIAGLTLFGAGLLTAGLAPHMLVFIAGRALQGFGAGWTVVAIYVVVARVYDEGLRPRVFAALSAAWVLPALLGPVAAGAAADAFGWRVVFLGLVPAALLGAVALVPALRGIRPASPLASGTDRSHAGDRAAGRRRRLPAPGARIALGLALAQLAGQRLAWWSAPLLAVAVLVGVPALRDLLPAGALRLRRGLPATVSYRGLLSMTFFTAEAFVPLMLVEVHGFGPTQSGVPLTLAALGWSTAAWLQGRRREGRPRGPLIRLGLLLIAVADAGLILITSPHVSAWLTLPLWAVAGTGMGFAYPTTSLLTLMLSPERQQGVNSAALQVGDAAGSILGIAFAGTVLAGARQMGIGISPGLAVVFLSMAAVALLAAVGWTRVSPPEEDTDAGQRTVQPVQT